MEYSKEFTALLKEGQFTKELLGTGATLIGQANYATKGMYFQAFSDLSIGLERIGKLCLLLDFYIKHHAQFPSNKILRSYGHNLSEIYASSLVIVRKNKINFSYLSQLDDPIEVTILSVLNDFSMGDRYSNINLVTKVDGADPIARWHKEIDLAIFERFVRQSAKAKIEKNAAIIGQLMGSMMLVRHTSEAGEELNDVETASYQTGLFQAVGPYRRLYVLRIIRFWVELLGELQMRAQRTGDDVPYFSEIFGHFYNDDKYFKRRKTWDRR